MKENLNVLFIVIDAARARNLSCYGYHKLTTPNIDKLANEGVIFQTAYSCTNTTDSSLTSIFSGKYPKTHGLIHHGPKITDDEVRKLGKTEFFSETLKSYNYTTLAVDWIGRWHKRGYDFYSGAPSTCKLMDLPLKLGQKFLQTTKMQRFEGLLGRLAPKYEMPYMKATNVTNYAIDLLKKNYRQKFFLFIHYWDLHFPYNSPHHHTEKYLDGTEEVCNQKNIKDIFKYIGNPEWKAHLQRWTKGTTDINYILAQYDGAISYVDSEIKKLVDFLDEYGISEETLVIITSDHGESLTEHGIFFDHHGLYEVSIHVPIIMRGGCLPKNRRIKGLVQHIDIMPTILDILRIPKTNALDGKSLLPLVQDTIEKIRSHIYIEESYVEQKRAIRTEKFKYIEALSEEAAVCNYCKCIHGGIRELYDLHNDPDETKNVIEEKPEVANALRDRLFELIGSLEKRWESGEERKARKDEIDREDEEMIIERLKSLGYLG